ncbi:hypothetical protein [Bradyrhizobium sp. HKCCYLR1023]|uniref:hypothetical protein n=1 Tax=Bradyrhizobium TaxID=374 RepID=UPI003EBF81B5
MKLAAQAKACLRHGESSEGSCGRQLWSIRGESRRPLAVATVEDNYIAKSDRRGVRKLTGGAYELKSKSTLEGGCFGHLKSPFNIGDETPNWWKLLDFRGQIAAAAVVRFVAVCWGVA